MENMIAGFSAGALSTLILHPLDLVKVRFQVNEKTRNQSIVSAIKRIGTIENSSPFSPKRLYRGLSANFMGATASWGLYFAIYERIKSAWLETHPSISFLEYFCFSSLAGSMVVSVTNPIWVVKTRLCVNNVPGSPGYYTGVIDAFSKIYAKEGYRGFYKGFVPGLIGSSHGAIQFMFYEKMKEFYRQRYSKDHPVS